MGRLTLSNSTTESSAQAGGLHAYKRNPCSKLHVKGPGAGCEQVHAPWRMLIRIIGTHTDILLCPLPPAPTSRVLMVRPRCSSQTGFHSSATISPLCDLAWVTGPLCSPSLRFQDKERTSLTGCWTKSNNEPKVLANQDLRLREVA